MESFDQASKEEGNDKEKGKYNRSTTISSADVLEIPTMK